MRSQYNTLSQELAGAHQRTVEAWQTMHPPGIQIKQIREVMPTRREQRQKQRREAAQLLRWQRAALNELVIGLQMVGAGIELLRAREAAK